MATVVQDSFWYYGTESDNGTLLILDAITSIEQDQR